MKQFKPKRFETKKFNLNKRETRTKRGYDADWEKFRWRFKHYNPECYACGSAERINVDHIQTRRAFPELAKEPTNFMPLCQSCHSTVTATFEMKNPPDIEGKIVWINKKREMTGTTVRIKVIPYVK